MAGVNFDITGRDRASPTIKSVHGLFSGLQAEAKKSILTGIGLGAGMTAFNALGNAARGAVDFMQEVASAAIEDEHSVSQLSAALKANVPGWDGTTKAIDRRIKASEALGFSDDEIRASMASLVGATHDQGKALEVQSTAMDLARFKNISLQEATDALVKVEAGRFRILASLGIVLRAGATQTEALAAVQKVAGGQAEAFGKTTEGAMKAAGIAFDEMKEDIGKQLLPVLLSLAKFARDDLIPALRQVGDVIGTVAKGMGVLGDALAVVRLDFGLWGKKIREVAVETGKDYDTVKDKIKGYMLDMGMSFKEAADKAEGELTGRTVKAAVEAADKIRASWETNRPRLKTAAEMLAQTLPDALTEGKDKAVIIATALPGDIAKAIRDGRAAVPAAMEQLKTDIKDSVSQAARLAGLQAQLIDPAIATGMESGEPLLTAQAQSVKDLILGQFHDVDSSGILIGSKWVDGITAGIIAREKHLVGKIAAMRRYFGESLPKVGPFAHIETGGLSIGKRFAESIGEGIGSFKMPGLSLPGLSGGVAQGGGLAMAGAASGGGSPIVVQVMLNDRMLAEAVTRQQYYASSGASRLPRG